MATIAKPTHRPQSRPKLAKQLRREGAAELPGIPPVAGDGDPLPDGVADLAAERDRRNPTDEGKGASASRPAAGVVPLAELGIVLKPGERSRLAGLAVIRCALSERAALLLNRIAHYAMDSRSTCFARREALMLECGWNPARDKWRQRYADALAELEAAGEIVRQRGRRHLALVLASGLLERNLTVPPRGGRLNPTAAKDAKSNCPPQGGTVNVVKLSPPGGDGSPKEGSSKEREVTTTTSAGVRKTAAGGEGSAFGGGGFLTTEKEVRAWRPDGGGDDARLARFVAWVVTSKHFGRGKVTAAWMAEQWELWKASHPLGKSGGDYSAEAGPSAAYIEPTHCAICKVKLRGSFVRHRGTAICRKCSYDV